ncbi:hypothetical protein O1L60_11800 [Streptomyces diastatochromogenes]|nr:hypothetical protein [Streptomyces diastatochromogenes]
MPDPDPVLTWRGRVGTELGASVVGAGLVPSGASEVSTGSGDSGGSVTSSSSTAVAAPSCGGCSRASFAKVSVPAARTRPTVPTRTVRPRPERARLPAARRNGPGPRGVRRGGARRFEDVQFVDVLGRGPVRLGGAVVRVYGAVVRLGEAVVLGAVAGCGSPYPWSGVGTGMWGVSYRSSSTGVPHPAQARAPLRCRRHAWQ